MDHARGAIDAWRRPDHQRRQDRVLRVLADSRAERWHLLHCRTKRGKGGVVQAGESERQPGYLRKPAARLPSAYHLSESDRRLAAGQSRGYGIGQTEADRVCDEACEV